MGKLGSQLSVLLFVAACGGGGDDHMVTPGHQVDASTIDARFFDARPVDGAPDAFEDHLMPGVKVNAPVNTLIYSGQVSFDVDVTDAEAITSVTATVGNHTIDLTLDGATPGKYRGNFDSTTIAGVVAPSVTVRAINAEGLLTDVAFVITLDNQPPVAELDPPKVRVQASDMSCSTPLDPVSPDAPNDLSTVAQLVEFRARVVDLPNSGTLTSTVAIAKAGVSTVTLYILDDTTQPLVVDSNGDGNCDEINPKVLPTIPPAAGEASSVNLTAVTGAGSGVFLQAGNTFGPHDQAAACTDASADKPFAPICSGEPQQSLIIAEPVTGKPEIYGIPPLDTLNCMGYVFDMKASSVADGWACAAVAVSDALGNKSVSPPIRVCVSKSGGACTDATPAPNCTGTYSGGTVSNTACTFRPSTDPSPQRFVNYGVANDNELITP